MQIDSPAQQKLLLELISQAHFPGTLLSEAYFLRLAVEKAQVGPPGSFKDPSIDNAETKE